MNKEKEIKEMAKNLSEVQNFGLVVTESQMDSRMSYSREIKNNEVAEALYNAGYRKQSEGEWIAYPDEHEICATEFVCSNCKESFCTSEMTDWQFIETMKFCPNCGAKMKKGGN